MDGGKGIVVTSPVFFALLTSPLRCAAAAQVQEVSRAVAEDGQQVIATAAKFDFDWTYTTEYAGSVEGATVRDVPSNEAVIDMDLLMRPDPILYFKDVVLFEDELHDNGMASNRYGSQRQRLLLAHSLTFIGVSSLSLCTVSRFA